MLAKPVVLLIIVAVSIGCWGFWLLSRPEPEQTGAQEAKVLCRARAGSPLVGPHTLGQCFNTFVPEEYRVWFGPGQPFGTGGYGDPFWCGNSTWFPLSGVASCLHIADGSQTFANWSFWSNYGVGEDKSYCPPGSMSGAVPCCSLPLGYPHPTSTNQSALVKMTKQPDCDKICANFDFTTGEYTATRPLVAMKNTGHCVDGSKVWGYNGYIYDIYGSLPAFGRCLCSQKTTV